jgi:hypothetical protein
VDLAARADRRRYKVKEDIVDPVTDRVAAAERDYDEGVLGIDGNEAFFAGKDVATKRVRNGLCLGVWESLLVEFDNADSFSSLHQGASVTSARYKAAAAIIVV